MSPIDDNPVIGVEFTPTFHRWLGGLRDRRAVYRITQRIVALRRGHWGDVKPVGDGVSEMRIFYGPGYRLYATQRDAVWIVMLAGGDKDSQRRDIEEAKRLARELRDGD